MRSRHMLRCVVASHLCIGHLLQTSEVLRDDDECESNRIKVAQKLTNLFLFLHYA